MASEVWNVKSILDWTTKYLTRISRSPRLDAEILLSHVTGKNRLWLYTNFDSDLERETLARYREAIKLRYDGTPTHYITGFKEFMALNFKVSAGVLVPRPETEELVERVIVEAKKEGWKKFVDVGTGSGVIAVSIAKYVEDSEVWAFDVDEKALKLAAENSRELNVAERVHVVRAGEEPTDPDVLVSNPPYLTAGEWEELEELHAEPYRAFVGGESGNDVYAEILERYSPKVFYFEIAHPFRFSLREILEMMGFQYAISKDISGRDRILKVWKKDGENTSG